MGAAVLRKLASKVQRVGIGGLTRAGWHKLQMRAYSPRISISKTSIPLRTLGTAYGGWTIIDAPALRQASIVCCGAGEDVSFDVEMARDLACRVLIVDPTPRAVAHVRGMLALIGQSPKGAFVYGGQQPLEAYDLRDISLGQITLAEAALWTESGSVRFFAPRNPEHVSHSIVNIQNNMQAKQDGGYIEVPAVTLDELVEKIGNQQVELLKLDIEGAEIIVLNSLKDMHVRPGQLLVEFDGLNFPSVKTTRDVEQVDTALRSIGYDCYHSNGKANYLYALRNTVAEWERRASN